MTLPSAVEISEEGPREGFQIEPGPIPTASKVELIDALSATGLRNIQIASFVSPRRVPGMVDADEVVARIDAKPGVSYSAIWFNEAGLERALAFRDRLTLSGKIRAYASEAFLQKNLNRTPADHAQITRRDIARFGELGIPINEASVIAAFGCNFEGGVTIPDILAQVAIIKGLIDEYSLPIDTISLADTMAWATPLTIKQVVGAVQDRYPELAISLHLHDTRGMAIGNAFAALEMGVTQFDAAVGGLGGCPFAAHKGAAGNICTEDLVFMCQEMGIETGVDLESLIQCAWLAERIVGHPLPGQVMRGGSLASLRTRTRPRRA